MDATMTEANGVVSRGTVSQFGYVKEASGGTRGRALKALRVMLRQYGRKVPKIENWRDFEQKQIEKRRILTHEVWVLEEWVYEHHRQKAVALFATVGAMFGYLKEAYGGAQSVLSMLRWLLRVQRERRKTLCL